MTKDEALKLALEAMEQIKQETFHPAKVFAHSHAITALRKALAEQPSTVEGNGGKTGWPPGLLQDDCKGLSKWLSNQPDARRRVREALAEQPAQQPPTVAELLCVCGAEWEWRNRDWELVATPPAQRTWVGLTDEEIPEGVLLAIRRAGLTLVMTAQGYHLMNLGPIEAAHGIKGEA